MAPAAFVAFVHGYDWGSNGTGLTGLHDRLDRELGVQRLPWEQHVLATAFPDRDALMMPGSVDENRWAIDAAVVFLRRFLTHTTG